MAHNHKHHSRRDILKLFGVSTGLALYQSPLQILIESIVLGAQRTALADTLGLQPRNYVEILHEGAPPRWVYDLFLTPYSNTGFVSSQLLGTVYDTSKSAAAVQYSTISKAGLNVPPIWQFTAAAAGGGTRALDPLLQNMMVIRGVNVGNPDHGAAQALQFVPNGATQSLTALSADACDKPIAGINLSSSQYQFISQKSKSAVSLANSGTMLSTLMAPFMATGASSSFVTNKAKLGSSLDAAIDAINAAAASTHANTATMSSATVAARDLLSQSFTGLTTTWNTLYAKYNSLITKSIDPTLIWPGLNDRAIISDGSGKFQLNGTPIGSGTDLRTLFAASTNIGNMATHFAVAEYVLTMGLSSSITMAPSGLYNLQAGGTATSLNTDEHLTSGTISTIANTYMALAESACLLELIDQLKAKNMFTETVITVGGEFSRCPLADGTGSDHGYMGGSTAVYSGAIKGPIVLGNIYNNSILQGANYASTWGLGAPVTELGRPLSLSDWAATVAYLLRVPSPTTAASSLLTTSPAGIYVPLIELARQV